MLGLLLPATGFAQGTAPGGSPPAGGSAEPPGVPRPSEPAPPPTAPGPTTPPGPTIPSIAAPTLPPLGTATGAAPAATFRFVPAVSVSEEYTDNFNRSSGRGRQDNFRTSVSPSVGLLINGARTTGQVGYTLSGAYDHSTDATNLFHLLVGQVSWQATPRLQITAADALTRTDEPEQADRLNLRRERRTFTINTFSLGADYRIAEVATRESYALSTFFDEAGKQTISQTIGVSASKAFAETNTGTLAYQYSTSETSDDADTAGHQLTVAVARQLNVLTSAGVSASYEHREFSGRATTESATDLWSTSLFSAYTGPKWSLSGSLGYSRLTSDSGAEDSSFLTATTLSYRFARGTATVSVDQGFSETFVQGENFGVVKTRGVAAGVTYALTPAIGAGAAAFYRHNDFSGIGGGEAGRVDDTWGASLGFTVQLLRWLKLVVDGAYTRQDSSSADGGFTERRARLSLQASF